jgi:hypothetical protein
MVPPVGKISLSSKASNANNNNEISDDITVERFLEIQCDSIIADLHEHGKSLIEKLRAEFQANNSSIRKLLATTSADSKKVLITLKVLAGPHLGQKFRLEPSPAEEDTYKMGRSTGKLFKEKGVSLYKDKEISTTHAKIETRNGQIFMTDVRSTNGTVLNGKEIEAQMPMRIKDGDLIAVGSTELKVQVSEYAEDLENVESVSL